MKPIEVTAESEKQLKTQIKEAKKVVKSRLREIRTTRYCFEQLQHVIMIAFAINLFFFFYMPWQQVIKNSGLLAASVVVVFLVRITVVAYMRAKNDTNIKALNDLITVKHFMQQINRLGVKGFAGLKVVDMDAIFESKDLRIGETNERIDATVKIFTDAGVIENVARSIVLQVIKYTPLELVDIVFMLETPCEHRITAKQFVDNVPYIITNAKKGIDAHSIAAGILDLEKNPK